MITNSPDASNQSLKSEYGFPEISDEIFSLYRRVHQSHILFQLGIDESGKELQSSKSKCDSCLNTVCRRQKIDSRLAQLHKKRSPAKDKSTSPEKIIARRGSVHTYKPKKDQFSQAYAKIVSQPWYKIISSLLSVGALYTRDIVYALLPKSADLPILNILLSIIFIWLVVELILYSMTHSNYTGTFFFWLDLIGTASILMDIPWIMIGIGLNNNIFLIVKGGRMGRAARGAGSMRLIKLVKMVRMVKLFRIVQLFRKNNQKVRPVAAGDQTNVDNAKDTPENCENILGDDYSEIKPTKMGSLLADRVTQKVILGVLLSFLILPLFDVGTMDSGEKTFMALEDLEYIYSNHHNSTTGIILDTHEGDYLNFLNTFNDYHDSILYLEVGSELGDDFSIIEYDGVARAITTLRSEEISVYETSSGASVTKLNIRDNVQMEAALNIGLTSFIMSIFALGAFVINLDAFMLVYPLEYLVIVLKRLSSIAVHIHEKNNNEMVKNIGYGQEPDLFTSIMQSMTDIFYNGKREKMFINSLEQMKHLSTDTSDESIPKPKSDTKNINEEIECVIIEE